MNATSTLIKVGLLTLLAWGAVGTAAAQAEPDPRLPAVQGRIEAIHNDGFTLRTKLDQFQVRVTEETHYHVPGVHGPDLDDLQVGDGVLALGRREVDGDWIARSVSVLPPVPVHALNGAVTAIEGRALTVATPGTQVTLLVDENTQFRIPEAESPGLGDIEVGDRLFSVARAEDGILTARVIQLLPNGVRGPIHFRGRGIAVGSASLTALAGERRIPVHTSENADIYVPDKVEASLGDVCPGEWVLAIGRRNGQAGVEAHSIGMLPPMTAHRFAIPGKILAIEGATLMVQDPQDTHRVHTGEQTTIRIPGHDSPDLDGLQVGDHIVAFGKPTEGHNLLARLVIVRRPPNETEAVPTGGNLPL